RPASVKGWTAGTHRAVSPDATWAAVEPLLERAGVTRMADLTGLDRIGLPVRAAIRPRGRILQTTNGKGLRDVDARVSAAMEALEHAHCEAGPAAGSMVRASSGELESGNHGIGTAAPPAGTPVIAPGRLPLAIHGVAQSSEARIPWVQGRELRSGTEVWLPAGAVFAEMVPRLFAFSANGLASGNTVTEATLHALYEVVERDVVTRRIRGGLSLRPPTAERVVEDSVTDAGTAGVLARIRGAGLRASLMLLRHPGRMPVFWCALLDPAPFHPCTRVTFGYGAHLSPAVAAVRALTEAAQARLSYISGMREDLARKIELATEARVRPVFDYFDGLEPTLAWTDIQDLASDSLESDLATCLELTAHADGAPPPVYRAELTWDGVPLAVVRVLMEGAVVDRRWF
ncbi:MAG TPA: YcaO-like family protein, partial [Longimicrobiales bacterium]|nr:YcaO-like family protein [Longimicrobiales bacterium]